MNAFVPYSKEATVEVSLVPDVDRWEEEFGRARVPLLHSEIMVVAKAPGIEAGISCRVAWEVPGDTGPFNYCWSCVGVTWDVLPMWLAERFLPLLDDPTVIPRGRFEILVPSSRRWRETITKIVNRDNLEAIEYHEDRVLDSLQQRLRLFFSQL